MNRESYQDIVKTLVRNGVPMADAIEVAKNHALENLKQKISRDYEMNMVLTRIKNK